MNDKPPTLAECKRWREMAAAATEGPWWTEGGAVWVEGGLWDFRLLKVKTHIDPQATAAFITESRTAVPRLAEAYEQAIDALRCALDTIKAFHGPVAWELYRDHAPEMKRIRAAIPEDGE